MSKLFADERVPLAWGLVWGVIQAASPFAFWWLDAATVYALSLARIRPSWVHLPTSEI